MITTHLSRYEAMAANAGTHLFQRKSPWAVRLFERMKETTAIWLAKENDDIRRLLPKPGSCYAYGLGVICPIDRTPLSVFSWDNPGHVGCANGHTFPNEQYPDTGSGYLSAERKIHYFAARWNGHVVTELTFLLKPLTYMYLITGEDAYAEKAAVILDGLATLYPDATAGPLDYPGLAMSKEGGRLERPYYQTARHLRLYGEAYAVLQRYAPLDTPSPTCDGLTMRDNIRRNLLANGGNYCFRESHLDNYWPLHNGTADYNMGALVAGLLCGIPDYVDWALHGRSSVRRMLDNAVDWDGNYYETSLSYSLHTQSIYLQVAEMLYDYRDAAHPDGINLYDDPKFRPFCTEFKRRNAMAGRLPQYGDTSVDPFERTDESSMYDAGDFVRVMMFAVRTRDEAFRQHCRRLLGQMNMTEAALAKTDGHFDAKLWLLFHTSPEHFEIAPLPSPALPADVLTGKGLVFLRYGEGVHERGLFMRYGTTLNHGQYDELALLLYDHGKEWSYDPGYFNTHYRFGWTMQTVAHLAVTINEASQLRLPSGGGSLDFFGSDGVISCAQASDPAAYKAENALLYTRFLAHIPVDEAQSYYLDIFHVDGGHTRDYSFHARGSRFSSSLEAGVPAVRPAWSDYEWGKQVDGDYRLTFAKDEPFYWTPPGDGYRFFGNVRSADGSRDWHAVWEDERRRKLRLRMLGSADREIYIADGPDPMGVNYVLARDKGKSVSQYAAIIDTADGDFPVRRVRRLELARPSLTAVCFRVDTEARTDYIYYSLEGADNAFDDDGTTFRVSGTFCCLQRSADGKLKWFGVNGTAAGAADKPLRAQRNPAHGAILDVDYEESSITVAADCLPEGGVVGERLHVLNPHYSHESCYTVIRCEPAGDRLTKLVLDKPLLLAVGKVSRIRGNLLFNEVELSYACCIAKGVGHARKNPSDYFNRKRIVGGAAAVSHIVAVRGDYPFHVIEAAEGACFRAGDELRIYDLQPGDRFRIPAITSRSDT